MYCREIAINLSTQNTHRQSVVCWALCENTLPNVQVQSAGGQEAAREGLRM